MKIEIEIRTSMSRSETFKALQFTYEAATRLIHRMSDHQLDRLAEIGADLIGAATEERARRGPRQLDRAAAGPSERKKISAVT